MIVEVLSSSMTRTGRIENLCFCKTFDSLEATVSVWQDKRRVGLRRRIERGRLGTDTIG